MTRFDTGAAMRAREFFRRVRLMMWVANFVILGIYSWLQLRNLPYASIINHSDGSGILTVALWLMYLSWSVGLALDVNIQDDVYVAGSKSGRIIRSGYLNLASLVVVAIVLIWARESFLYFSIALTAFSLTSLWGIKSVQSQISPLVQESKSAYAAEDNWFGHEQITRVNLYVAGRWVWARQIVLWTILPIVDVMCWVPQVRDFLGSFIHALYPSVRLNSIVTLLPIASLVFFITLAETWQWFMRLKTKILVDALKSLKGEYTINRKAHEVNDDFPE